MPRAASRGADAAGLSRRDFLRGGAAALATALPALGCSRRTGPPNVVLVVADDLGVVCLGCYGGTSYRTPHLDRLARTGTTLTQAWATPLCTPSRVQLMSGQYPFRNGWTSGLWERPRAGQVVDADLILLGRVLRDAGLATCVAGKWQLALFADHPDHAARCGFDEHCLWTWKDPAEARRMSLPRYWEPAVWQNGEPRELAGEDAFGPDVFCDYLIDFIRRHRSRPFFAYYPMVLPHPPMVATPRNRSRLGGLGRNNERLFPGMVAYLDSLVGRIVETLDELGLREHTLVIFTSDNGTPPHITSQMRGRAVPGGKGTLTRRGAQVPFLASRPGTVPIRIRDDLVDLSDVLPTLADVTGARIPTGHPLDGRSLAPQLRGETGSPRDWVLVQLGDAKMVVGPRFALYDDGRLCDRGPDCDPLPPGEGGPEAEAARARLQAVLASLS